MWVGICISGKICIEGLSGGLLLGPPRRPSIHADAEIQVVDLSHPARVAVAMQKVKCSLLRSNFYLGKRSKVAALEEDIDMKQSAKCHDTRQVYSPVQNRYVAHAATDGII